MAAPYSLDLRERVVAAVAAGVSRKQAAAHYQVSHSSAIRWTKREAETGSPAALPMGGKKPFTLADEEAWIRARVAEKPDLTGRELLAELNQRGIEVSYYGVWHFLDHVGLSFKKKPPRQRAGSRRRRAAAAAMAAAPEQGHRRTADFHRRNLGEDQHDAAARTLRQRPEIGREGAARSSQDADLRRGLAL
jgi:transposase